MGRPEFVASASAEAEPFLRRWNELSAGLHGDDLTPFQTTAWLRSWYATLGQRSDHAPLCVTVTRAGRPVLLLPLVAERNGALSTVRFADGGVTDYNAPLIVGEIAADEAGALWVALRKALAGHHLLQLDKMLVAAGARANPLVRALRTEPCDLFGNHVVLDADWDTWRHSLDKTVRKEFERTWRVFTREPEAVFERVTDPAAARPLFAELEVQQRARMAHAGDRYRLDRPAWRALYAERLQAGLADGSVVLTALRARGQVIAALYGISDGTHYVALRISHAGDAWKHCAPGKLLLERTMHHLHGQGLRHIDFAIGDYFHKRVFKVSRTPLVEACVALGWRGLPAMGAWRGRRWMKRQKWMVAAVRRLRRPSWLS